MANKAGSKIEAGIEVLEGLARTIRTGPCLVGTTRTPQITESLLMQADQAIADIKAETRKMVVPDPVLLKQPNAGRGGPVKKQEVVPMSKRAGM